MTAPLLTVERLVKSFFGVRVLHEVGFTLRAGEVLGLVGENGSGKSTTMNILGGIHQPDSGAMTLDGAAYAPAGPRDAEGRGIAFIHQELNLFRNLTVEENLFIGGFPKLVPRLPFIDRRRMRARSREFLQAVELDIAPDTPMSRLSQGERQLVEIAKAVGAEARIVIFDEPTTSLTARESARLFALIDRLKARGIAVIYISHILSDVMRLCDRVTTLRDGHVVGSAATAEMTIDRLITLMVGRTIDQIFPARTLPPREGTPVLEVEGLSQPGVVHDLGFAVRQGEVLGVSGLMGSGRSEMARILFGLDPHKAGTIRVDGEVLEHPTPQGAMERGLAFLTEDRRVEGLLMDGAIADNLALPSLPSFSARLARLVEQPRLAREVAVAARDVHLSTQELARTLAKNLSGGNQQKVVIGKWLLRGPRLFILDEPTRGIDVGAKYEVYKIINQLAASGAGILMISSEIEELIGMCDRILVMGQGEIRGRFEHKDFDREALMRAAMWDKPQGVAA